MDRNDTAGLGDEQGTRVGAPDQQGIPSTHSDSPPDRPERQTGAGAEATVATREQGDEHQHEHRGGYGGAGGAPVTSNGQ